MESEKEFPTELRTKTFNILSSNDNADMEALFANLFSPEPQSEALTFLQCSKKHHPDLLFIKLFFLLRCADSPLTRSHSARALHLLDPTHLWPNIKPIAQAHLKAHFIAYLHQESSLQVLKHVSLVIAETVSVIYTNNQNQHWPEILDFLVSSISSNDDVYRETALLVFASLRNDCRLRVSDSLRSAAHVLRVSFLQSLNSSNTDVKVASFGAVVSLVRLFSDPCVFHELLRAMMVAVFSLLHGSDGGANFRRAFSEMVKLVSEEPTLLKPYASDMVLDVLQIAESDAGLSRETQCAAFEMVMAMAEMEEYAAVLANLPRQNLARVLLIPLKMLMCVSGDDKEKGKEEKEDCDAYKIGMKWLDRLCVRIGFGESKVVSVGCELLQLYLDAPDWKKRHAGITMLTLFAKHFSDEMVLMEKNFLGEMVTKVLKAFHDSHVRVRLAAFSFMQMPTTFVQVMHILYHHRLMHAFAIALDNDHNNCKVKEQAASAMRLFFNNTLPDSLTLYKNADPILMSKLISMLQAKNLNVKDQEECEIQNRR